MCNLRPSKKSIANTIPHRWLFKTIANVCAQLSPEPRNMIFAGNNNPFIASCQDIPLAVEGPAKRKNPFTIVNIERPKWIAPNTKMKITARRMQPLGRFNASPSSLILAAGRASRKQPFNGLLTSVGFCWYSFKLSGFLAKRPKSASNKISCKADRRGQNLSHPMIPR